jgi:hypothetical protein
MTFALRIFGSISIRSGGETPTMLGPLERANLNTYRVELNDLRIPYVTEVIRTYAKKHKNRTARNDNQLIRDLFNQPEIGRRLNRMWPEDLIR